MTARTLTLAYLRERAAVLILPVGDAPPIRTVDAIDRDLGYALRTREAVHALRYARAAKLVAMAGPGERR